MKLNKLFILLLAVIYLSGCGKTILPSENDQEEETEKETPSSTPVDDETVYSVEEFIEGNFGDKAVWVQGYIVGAYKRSIKQAEWEPPFSYNTAILLADSPGETDPDKVISIQMVNKQMKENIALDSNPQNYGRQIAFLGIKQKYLGIPGIKKHILAIEWLDE